eukprot:125555-Lingulodinium_polyedra.AAC.1
MSRRPRSGHARSGAGHGGAVLLVAIWCIGGMGILRVVGYNPLFVDSDRQHEVSMEFKGSVVCLAGTGQRAVGQE